MVIFGLWNLNGERFLTCGHCARFVLRVQGMRTSRIWVLLLLQLLLQTNNNLESGTPHRELFSRGSPRKKCMKAQRRIPSFIEMVSSATEYWSQACEAQASRSEEQKNQASMACSLLAVRYRPFTPSHCCLCTCT